MSPKRNFIDLTGKKFGRLKVLKYSHKDSRNKSYWECICNCGEKTVIRGDVLTDKRGKVRGKSCGCARYNFIGKGISSRNGLIHDYRRKAKKRAIICRIKDAEFVRLFEGNCSYCGVEPYNEHRRRTGKWNSSPYKYNGIDRVNNNKGYIKGNVVSCCMNCNFAKRKMTVTNFNLWLDRITKFRGVKMEGLRTFKMYRFNDESGVSGTGLVVIGVIFENGQCVTYWRSRTPSLEISISFAHWYNIHVASHPTNGTNIVFDDGQPMPEIKRRKNIKLSSEQ